MPTPPNRRDATASRSHPHLRAPRLVNARPFNNIKSRDPPITQPSFHTAPSPAATSGGGSVFRFGARDSFIPSWPPGWNAGLVWPLLPLKTASCFRQPHGLPHSAACAPSHVCRHRLVQINPTIHLRSRLPRASTTCCGKQPTPLTSQQAGSGWPPPPPPRAAHRRLGRRILDKGGSMSSGVHPPNHHHLICAHDAFFFLPSSSSCWVVGSRFGSFPPPPHRQDRSPPLHPRDGAMTGFGSVKPHVNPTPTVAHTSQCVAWPCGTTAYIGVPYFIRLAGRRRVERDAVIATAGLGKFPGGRCLAFPGGRGSLCSVRLWSFFGVW